ncbi:MAG: hypothetical protein LBM98_02530 [Oscillospiraceae bacterium]|nr:hypothetical protein [Oscillospiraceae bacterium]
MDGGCVDANPPQPSSVPHPLCGGVPPQGRGGFPPRGRNPRPNPRNYQLFIINYQLS